MSITINFEILKNLTIVDSECSSNSSTSKHSRPKITYLIEPKGTRFEEAKRVIALVYSYDKKNVRYGASIFRKINKNDVCIKSQIRETAMERFNKQPVCFTMCFKAESADSANTSNTSDFPKPDDVVNEIRFKMHKYGVKSKDGLDQNQDQTQLSNLISSLTGALDNQQSDQISNDSEIAPDQRTPRVSYVLEPAGSSWHSASRIIAIAYSYDNNEIYYGASIFKRTFPNELCIKSDIRSTAIERFYEAPVVIDIKAFTQSVTESLDPSNQNNKMLHIRVTEVLRIIRKIMYKFGVKNKLKLQ